MKLIAMALLVATACEPTEKTTEPRCEMRTPTVLYRRNKIGRVAGFSEDEIYEAAIQMLTSVGFDPVSKDAQAHTIVTRQVGGETLVSTCPANLYRTFAFRIAIAGENITVAMDCWESGGVEPRVYASFGTRTAMTPCDDYVPGQVATLISARDARLQDRVVDGIREQAQLRRVKAP